MSSARCLLIIRVARKLIGLFPNKRLRAYALHWIHLNLEDCEPELKNLIKLIPPLGRRRVAIDIGANCGYYSIELEKYFGMVYAFEIIPDLAVQLAKLSQRLHVIRVGISSEKGSAKLYIPVIGNAVLTGWASLNKGNCPDAEYHIEMDLPIQTLDSFGLVEVDFIKIDVEGHECQVLLGARETLVNNSPVLLVEVKDANRIWVESYLKSLGYNHLHLDFQSLRKPNENHVFIKKR